MKSISLNELKKKIISFDNVLIVSHINPDPDTLGSALGLQYIFKKLGKNAHIVCDTKINPRICGFFGVIPELDLENTRSPGFLCERIICIDAASAGQLGRYEKYWSEDISRNKIDLVIDHHFTNSFYGKKTYLDTAAAATGEIIYDLAEALDIGIDKNFASYIYCSIIEDTGSFRYMSTTPKTMRTAARLMETGLDFAALGRLIFQNKTKTQFAMERLAYDSAKFSPGGKIAFVIITKDIKKNAGLEDAEIEGINDISRSVEGVEVGVTVKEAESGEYYISLRSNEYVNVADIAAHFGGGGHIRAAGCRYKGTLEALELELTKKIEEVL